MGKPSIPTNQIQDRPTREAIQALAESVNVGEGRHGKIRDKWVTWGEMEKSGLAKLESRSAGSAPGSGGGERPEPPDQPNRCTSTPPAPAALTARGAFQTIILDFTDPYDQYNCHDRTEFRRGDSMEFGASVRAGTTQAGLWSDPVGNNVTRYYWSRHVNQDGNPGPWTGPVEGTTDQDPAYVLDVIQGEITDTELHSDLNSRIDRIDDDAGLSDRLSGLSLIEVGDKLERRLHQREVEAQAELSSLMDGASEGLMDALMRANETINRERYTRDDHYRFKDAIAEVDPDTGEILLKAVEEVKDGSTQTLTDLESSIQVNSDEIALRATKTELDNTAQDILKGFEPAYSADWFDSKESWTAYGATLTANGDSTVTLDSGGTIPQMEVSGLSFDGGDNARVQILMKRVAGSGWAGKLWWATADHGFGDTYDDGTTVYDTVATFSEIADDNDYHVAYLTLRDFDDWVSNTITGLRVQFGNTTDDIFDIDRFEAGKSQIEQLIYDDLDARISDNESMLSVHSDEIEARVTKTTFDGAEDRITQNESDIQVNADAIDLKAAQSQVDDHESRIDTAETNIDANESEISNQVTSTTRLWEEANEDERGPEALVEALIGEWDDFVREQNTRDRVAIAETTLSANSDDISANASSLTLLEGRVGDNEGYIQDILDLDIGTDTALLTRFSALRGDVDTNAAAITDEEKARVDADEAEATRRSDQYAVLEVGEGQEAEALLEQLFAANTAFTGNMAAIHRESVTRQTDDESLAKDITALGASLDDTEATLQDEQEVRASEDDALAEDITSLQGSVDDNSSEIFSIKELTVDSSTALASEIDQLNVGVDDNSAAISQESTTRASEDDAIARYAVNTDVNGHIAGLGIETETGEGGTTTSSIIMLADRFAIGLPAGPWQADAAYDVGQYVTPTDGNGTGLIYRCITAGTTGSSEPSWPTSVGNTVTDGSVTWEAQEQGEQYPFTVGTVDGVTQVAMDAAKIEDLTITDAKIKDLAAEKIAAATLDAIASDMGHITAGSMDIGDGFSVDSSGNVEIVSSSTGARMEIKNKTIKVFDSGDQLRVQIGDLSA